MRSSTSLSVMPCSRSRATSRSRVRADVMPMPLTLLWSFTCAASAAHSVRPPSHSPISVERRMARQVDLQRRDRHVAIGDGMEVRALARVRALAGRPHPVHRAAARIGRAQHGRRAMPVPEARRLEAAQLLVRQVGHVDVEDHRRVQRRALQAQQQFARHARGRRRNAGLHARPARSRSRASRGSAPRRPPPPCPNTARRRRGWRRR